ncbi:hypothetical protein WG954_18530 [Lacibacter sp. H375]|uniref:hypothetical protein n=1 Tax=Lacibacter sp. H375 TaxID=3133424 RepID=UPI0030C0DB82
MKFYSIFAALIFFSLNVCAQVPAQYRADVNKVLSQNQTNFMQNQMRMNSSMYKNQSTDFNLTVELKDGRRHNFNSFFYYDTILRKAYVEKVDRKLSKKDSNRVQKIYVDETARVTAFENAGLKVPAMGIVTDSCWLFPVVRGTITLYAFSPQMSDPNLKIFGMQMNFGSIQPFNEQKIELLVANNPKALKEFKKKRFMRAVEIYNLSAK